MGNRLKQAFQNKYFKNLLTIGLGAAIAQAIPVLASPILTRIFSPDAFGIFANYSALMAFLVVINTGKYELAIILPKEHKDAINIVALSFFILCLSTVGLLLIFALIAKPFASYLGNEAISGWIVLTPLGAFFANLYIILNEWYIRKDNYSGLSKNRIGNTASIAGSSLLFGTAKVNLGLIWGQICGQIISIFLALKRIFAEDKGLLKYVSKKKVAYYAKRHVNFAKYIIPGQLLNTAATLIAISLITYKFGFFQAGLIALIDRVFGVPISVIANSVNDVFKLQVTETYRNKGNCLKAYKKVVLGLLGIAIVPFSILFFASPALFPFIFGQEWALAGSYAQALCFMFLLNLISMPTRWVFMVAEKQRIEFFWQIIFATLNICPILIGILFFDIYTTILLWSLGKSVSYVIFLIMTYSITKRTLNVPFKQSQQIA